MMEEKKVQLDKVRRAFRNPNLRGWIPGYLLTILEQGDDIEDTRSKMEQVMPKYCEPRKFATEELQSLDEGSEKQNDWRSLLVELSPAVRTFWEDRYDNYINPNYEQLELEKALRACALLPSKEELAAIPDKKFGKKQKAALLNAFVSHYQWSYPDWMEVKDYPISHIMIQNLLWGCYENGELQNVFALEENGQITDGNGEALSGRIFSGQKRIGLVHPEELTEMERDIWKKYARKKKWKQPLPQLKIPVCQGQYDLAAFTGIQVTQLFMITAAGKWGLYQGSGRNQYMSYHMADLLHGYGAQLTFDGIWRGPEYGPEIITIDKVIFYRFRHFLLWDHVPESLVCAPEELPARFVSTAMAAFQGIIGKGKKKE